MSAARTTSASPSIDTVSTFLSFSRWRVITGSIARSATRRHLSYSEADFEVFRPHGPHVAPMGVKFSTEEETEGCLLHTKFHPIGATIRV